VCDDGRVKSRVVFRPWTTTALTVVVWLVVVVSLVSLAASGDVDSLRRFGPAFVALGVLTASLFLWPAVIVDGEAVIVRNPLTTTTIPWSEIEGIENRFGLRILLTSGPPVAAWAAPAGSRRTSARLQRRATDTSSRSGAEAIARDARMAGEGDTATAIRQELARRARTGAAPGPVETTRSINVVVVVAVVAALLAAIGFALT
jgi:hypothetical protein